MKDPTVENAGKCSQDCHGDQRGASHLVEHRGLEPVVTDFYFGEARTNNASRLHGVELD